MKVFITGSTGFIGRHVLEATHASGHDILALTLRGNQPDKYPKNIHWVHGDLSDLNCWGTRIKTFNPDIVIHLAWQGIPDYSELISRVNLNNSIDLFDYILSNTNCSKLLVSGSCWEYGKGQGACKESDLGIIDSYFTWAKHSLNQYLQLKCLNRNVILNWFRIFYIYGPGQREGSLIPTLIQSICESKIPSIHSPMNKNDFIYVKDVAKTLLAAADTNVPSGIYNLGSGYATSVYDVCKIVEKQLENLDSLSEQILKKGQPDETVNFWADMKKTEHALNVSFDTGLEEGIKQYISSMQLKEVL